MSKTETIKQGEAPDSTGSGVDLPRIVSLLRYGSEEEHRATLRRAKENNVSYVWSGNLRNPYLLENLRFGQDAGLIEVEFVEYYEAQESGYRIKYLEANVNVDTRDLSRCRPTPCSAPASGQTRTIGIHIFGPYLMYLVGDNKWENQRFHNKLFWRFGYETKKARELYWLTRRINPSQLKPNLPKRSFGAKLSQLFCIPLVKIALSDFYNDIILRRNPRPYSD